MSHGLEHGPQLQIWVKHGIHLIHLSIDNRKARFEIS